MLKYYAVRRGRQEGIFTSARDFKAAVEGFSNAAGKSFCTREQAQAYLASDIQASRIRPLSVPETVLPHAVAYTDGSYNQTQKQYGYGVVFQEPGFHNSVIRTEISGYGRDPEILGSRNIAGETVAVLKALEFTASRGIRELRIAHDFSGLAHWADGSWEARKPVSIRYRITP